MTTYRKEGKDVIIFATAEDHRKPSKVKLPDPEPQLGLILPNGEINWNCPCLGGMATGPCGVEFREVLTCFLNSEIDARGSDCYRAVQEMHLCMAEYPEVYNKYSDDVVEEDFDNIDLNEAEKALLNDSKIKEKFDVDRAGTCPRVEEKSPGRRPSTHTETKKSSKTSQNTGTLKVNG